ncbi:MAG: helicase-related protein [Candidatus Micrarchaeia archaeon]
MRIEARRAKIPSVVYDRVVDLVKEKVNRGEKVVIFTEFVAVAKDLLDVLSSNGINAAIITGDTTSIEREQNLRAFSDRKSPLKVLIVTRPVVSEAVNLTSANNVIFVNSPWTYQQVQQALSRVYRMGQEKDVMVYFINVAGTVTASQKRNIEQTKSIFESVFAPPNVKVKELLQNLVVRRRSEIQGKPLITISKRPSTLVENCELSVEVSEDAREINATLTVSEGKSVTINGWKNFVDAFLGRLSKESKEYLREFVILRTASEIQSRISIKDMFLWKLLSIFQPEINFKDYDGSIVSIIPKAVYFIYAIINDMTVEEMQRSFQMTEEDMKEVLNYLVKTGLLIKLSKIGLFEFDKVDTIVKQFNIRMGGINVGMDDNELSHDKFGAIIGYERIKLAKGLRKRNVFIKIDNEKLVRAIVDGDNIYFENTFLDILRKVHRLLKRKLQFYNEMVAEEREEIAIYENKMIDRFIRSLQLQLPPTKLTERIIELEEYLYSISEQVEDYFVKKLIDEIQGVLQILKQNPSVLEEYADMLILKLRELENKLPINLRVSVSPLSAIISAIAGLTVRFLTNERGESSVVDSVVIYWDSINIDASGNAEVEVMLVENSDAELRILSSDEVDKIIPRSQMMAILSMYGIKNVKINAKVIGKDRLKFNPQLLTRTILAGLPVWGLDYADPSCLASISLRNAWNFAFDLVKEAQKIYQANEDLAKRKLILAARILNNFCLEPEERISVRDEIVYNPDIKFCFDKIIEMLKIVALRYQYEVEEQHSGESKQGFGGIVFGDLRSIMSRLLGIPVSEVTQQKVIKYLESNVVSVDKEDLEIILRSGESALGVWQPEKIFINRRIRIGYDRIGRPIWITIKPVNAENMIISTDESIPVLVTRVDSLSFDIYIPSIFLDEEKMDTSIVSRILSHVIQYQVLVAANNPDMTLEELRNIDSVEWNKERTIWYGKEKRKLPSLKADVKQQIYCWLNNMRYLSDEKMSIFVRTIQAFAQFCNSHESASVLVGGFKDTLIASEIIAGNGIDVTLVEQPVSLAEIQYMMRQGKYNFGVYITEDGEILFLGSKGELLDRNTLKVIEKISKVVSKAKYMDYKIAEDIGRLKILREIGMHERFSGLLKASFPQQQVVVIDEDTLNLLKRTGVYNGVSPYIRGYTRDIPQFLRKTGVQDRKCIGMRITGQGVEYYDIDGRKILEDDLCIALVYYAYRYIGYRGNIRKNIITTSIVDTLVELLGGKIDGIDPISSDLTGDLRSKVATTDANNEIFSMNDNLIDYFKVALLLNSIISEKGSVYNLINEARRFLQEQGKISEMYSYERIGRKTEMELLQILSEDSIDELINLIEKETKKKVTEIFKGWKNAIKIDLDDGSFIIFRIEDGVTKVYVHSPNHRLNKSIAKKVLNWYYRKYSITVRSKELLISTIISILFVIYVSYSSYYYTTCLACKFDNR